MTHEQLVNKFSNWEIVNEKDYPDKESFRQACIEEYKDILLKEEEKDKKNQVLEEKRSEIGKLLSHPLEHDGIHFLCENARGEIFLKRFDDVPGYDDRITPEMYNLRNAEKFAYRYTHGDGSNINILTFKPSTDYQREKINRIIIKK